MYSTSHDEIGHVYTSRQLDNNVVSGIGELTISAKANIDPLRAADLQCDEKMKRMPHSTLPSIVGKWSCDARKKMPLVPKAENRIGHFVLMIRRCSDHFEDS